MIVKAIKSNKLRALDQNFNAEGQGLVTFKHENAKIALPTIHGMIFVKLIDICFFKSDDIYSVLYDVKGEKHFVCKSLKWIEERLKNTQFYRVHKGYIINLFNISKYYKNDGLLITECGGQVPISRRKRNIVCELIGL